MPAEIHVWLAIGHQQHNGVATGSVGILRRTKALTRINQIERVVVPQEISCVREHAGDRGCAVRPASAQDLLDLVILVLVIEPARIGISEWISRPSQGGADALRAPTSIGLDNTHPVGLPVCEAPTM